MTWLARSCQLAHLTRTGFNLKSNGEARNPTQRVDKLSLISWLALDRPVAASLLKLKSKLWEYRELKRT
jgi:hypothetical protein